jgi:CheY-like chemotaxis protein
MRILVVDDNEDAAESLGRVLRTLGHDVCVRYDGASALAMLGEVAVDVALVDIGLPDMSGYDVARAMGARAQGSVPVRIAITGWGGPDDKARADAAGFAHHLTKPVDPETLLAVLASLARQDR